MFNLLAVIASYLIGSSPSAVIASKCYGVADPCIYGSDNPGATNVLYSGKKKAAALTLLGDALKGVFAIVAARLLQDSLGLSDGIITITAVAVLAEHMWPTFFGFRGGKGVAAALGVLLTPSWPTALICATIWSVMTFGFRVSSLAMLMTTVISSLIVCFFMPHGSWVAATAIIAVLVPYRHKSNIENLLQGREGKIGDKAENQS